MAPKDINFISGNTNKLSEVRDILGDIIQVKSTPLDLVEIQGSSQDIVLDKCRRACDIVQGPVLVEDTALCFNSLNGLPGSYIKWFLESLGHEGLNNLLLAYDDKTAVAICTFAYCEGPGREPLLFEGRALGKIVAARGTPEFGWDPIFEYEGETYAEMEPTKKNLISHRSLALSGFRKWLETHTYG